MRRTGPFVLFLLAVATALPSSVDASEWAHWRGPDRNGTSPETGLIDGWSVEGENLIWRQDFVGRSTPVVLDGRVCASGRVGEDVERQELVACFDADSGTKLWERRFNVYHTSVPWTRVGWAHLAADSETGYLYAQGVGGLFHCLDSRDGSIVWSRRLIEEFGFMEGYGGRTQTPFVDGDRLIVTFSNTSWGPEGRPLHRFRAFDKRTGELLWTSTPAPSQADKNTQSTPNVMVVDGRRLIVAGNGGGGIYAVEASTGEPVWGFQLSKRGINSSVLVDGTRVYVSHSEENVDESSMGRVVAIDGTGEGDITQTGELWRAPISAGFTSAALKDGRLYILDNSANLHALDAQTGEEIWELSVGRVGKSSPVLADGKLYVTEVNGRFVIVDPGETEGRILDLEEIRTADDHTEEDRLAEIYGSPAISGGRIFFTTEEGIYCLGDKDKPYQAASTSPPAPEPAPAAGPAARLRVFPAETWIRPGETADFRVHAFDAKGRDLGEQNATWSVAGALAGSVDGNGVYTAAGSGSRMGTVVAKVGELEAAGRLRVLQDLPIEENFDDVETGGKPGYQMAYLARWGVADLEGNKVMAKGPSPVKIHRHITFLGHPEHTNYTIEADLMGTKTGRKVPDVGLINSGYTFELLGGHQRLQIRSWQSGLRMMRQIDYPWEFGVWYRMKLKVADGTVQGKVWPRGEEEPAEWTLTVEDPLPITSGAPGLSAYSPSFAYFDNLKVVSN